MIVTDGLTLGLVRGLSFSRDCLFQLTTLLAAVASPIVWRSALPAGKHAIVLTIKYDASRQLPRRHWCAEGRRQRISDAGGFLDLPFLLPADETFDVGIATRTG